MKNPFKKFMQPRREFAESARTRFLAVFDAAHPGAAHRARPHAVTAVARALIACGAAVAILSGVAVYADAANVSVKSALYPFKRFSENVQLAFASTKAKAQLQANFAERRAAEFSDLSAQAPSSTRIAQLSGDLAADVDGSVVAAHETNLGDGDLNGVCGQIYSAIASSSLALQGELPISAQAFVRFEKVCVEKEIAQNNGNSEPVATSTPAAPVSAPGLREKRFTAGPISPEPLIPILPTSTELQIRGGGSLDVIFGGNRGQHGSDSSHARQNGEAVKGNAPPSGGAPSDESRKGDVNAAASSSASATITAPTTVFVPDVQGYLRRHGSADVFGPQDSGDNSSDSNGGKGGGD